MRQRLAALDAARELAGTAGWVVVACGVVSVVSAVGGGFGWDAVAVGAAFVAWGAAMLVVGRRRWRLEHSGYRPSRFFYVAVTAALFAIAAGMFVGAALASSGWRAPLVLGGLYMAAMGVLGAVRTARPR